MSALTYQQSLDLALDYVAINPGRFLFPIKPGFKSPPLIKRNLEEASNNPAQLTEWAKRWPGCNWGLAHRKSKLLVVDVDTKAGKVGQATFDELDLAYGFPETEENRSPSGGKHLIYEGDHVFALGVHGFGPDIDSPNYTIIPGSSFTNGTSYTQLKAIAAAPAPKWFYDVIGKAKQKAVDAGEMAVDADKPENVRWAVDFLRNDAEPAIEGQAGDFQTLKIAMGLRDRGISRGLAMELMRDHYNERCIPPWSDDDLEKKVINGYAYANQTQLGGKTAEADFEDEEVDVEAIPTMGDAGKIAEEKKARAAAAERERAIPIDQRVHIWTKQEILDEWVFVADIDKFIKIDDPNTMWKRASFDAMFKYVVKGQKLSEALFAAKRDTIRRFETVGYVPGEGISINRGRVCNLYRKSTVVPRDGDISWWEEHLEYLFPDPTDRHHLMCWLSWFYQNLKRKPKHALLLQGRIQGTGKSFIADMLAKIIGDHNRAMVSQTDLGGSFNGYAMRTKLICIEELRAVERANVKNALHDIITQDTISINEKNMPKFDMVNCFGIICMTNDDAAISLDMSDRRYLVLRTNAEPRDREYYTRLYGMLEHPDAVAAVAYKLQNYDYGAYNGASRAPHTQAKEEMIHAGLSELETFLTESSHLYPLNGRVTTVADVIEMLPKRLERHPRLTQVVCSALKTHFGAQLAGQFRAGGGQRRRFYVINGSGLMNIEGWQDRISDIYDLDRKRASDSRDISDDEDASELTEADD